MPNNLAQLRFFKKLELYQDLKKLDREKHREWATEKKILSWAANRAYHRDLGTPLTPEMACNHQEITGSIAADISDKRQYVENRLKTLVTMGYAEKANGGIIFNSDGFLTGEIINESSTRRYNFFYILSWALLWAGVFVVIASAGHVLYGFACWLISVCTHHNS